MNKHGFVAPDRKPVESVEELRKIWESDREWISRRKFLDRHWGSIQPFELDSLSSVWLNNLVLGCRYPRATIERVKSLAEGLEVDNLTMLRGVPKEFVKGSKDDNEDDDDECSEVPPKKAPPPPKSIVGMNPFKKRKIGSTAAAPIVISDASPECERSSSVVENDVEIYKKPEKNSSVSGLKEKPKYSNFVNAQSSEIYEKFPPVEKISSETIDNESEIKDDISKNVSKKSKKAGKSKPGPGPADESVSPPQQSNFVPFKRSTSPLPEVVPAKKSFVPVVFDLEPTEAESNKKKNKSAAAAGINVTQNSQFSSASLVPSQNVKNKKRKKNQKFIGKFVIILEEGQMLTSWNAKEVLNRLVNFNKVDSEFINTKLADSSTKSEFYLNGQLISQGFGSTGKIAEAESAYEAAKSLQEILPVIQILKLRDKSADYIPESLSGYKGQVSHALNSVTSSENSALQSSNVGHKLLAKMGWTSGTGLGKERQGIVDPVEAVANRFRQGLGCEIDPKFLKEPGISKNLATKIISSYIESCSEEPITFSPSFTNEDRKILHFVARIASKKYNVKLITKSYGVEPDRYLTISRALTGEQLFDLAAQAGQKFGRYEVLSVGASGQ